MHINSVLFIEIKFSEIQRNIYMHVLTEAIDAFSIEKKMYK